MQIAANWAKDTLLRDLGFEFGDVDTEPSYALWNPSYFATFALQLLRSLILITICYMLHITRVENVPVTALVSFCVDA